MDLILAVILKTSAVILAAWVVCSLPHRLSAATRHMVWVVAALASVFLPLFITVIPVWELRVLPTVVEPDLRPLTGASFSAVRASERSVDAPRLPANPDRVRESRVNTWQLSRVLTALWLLGFGIAAFRALWGWTSVAKIASQNATRLSGGWQDSLRDEAEFLNIRSRVRLVISDRVRVPGVCGVYRPVLLVPPEALNWEAERRRLVLLHELAHVRRHDCLAQAMVQWMRAIHWFNPLAAVAANRSHEEQERACDDIVLKAGVSAPMYARHLVEIAAAARGRSYCEAATVAMAGSSRISSRVRAILDPRRNRRAISPQITASSVLVSVTLILALGTMRLAARAVTHLQVQSASAPAETSPYEPLAQTSDKNLPTTAKIVAKRPDFTGTWVQHGYVHEWPFGNYNKWVIRQTDRELRLDASSADNSAFHMVWYFNRWGKRWGSDWTNRIGRAQWDGSRLVTVFGGDGDEIRFPWIFELSPDGKQIVAVAISSLRDLGLSFDFKTSSISQVYVRHRLVYDKAAH